MFQSNRHLSEGPGSPFTGLDFFVNPTPAVWPRMHCESLPINVRDNPEIANTVTSRPEGARQQISQKHDTMLV